MSQRFGAWSCMLPRERACASLWFEAAFYVLGWCCLHRGPLWRYSVMVLEKFPMPSFTNCVNGAFLEKSPFPRTLLVLQPHLPSSERRLHSFPPHARTHSRLRASLNVQVVMTTTSVELNAALGAEAALILLHISTALMQW